MSNAEIAKPVMPMTSGTAAADERRLRAWVGEALTILVLANGCEHSPAAAREPYSSRPSDSRRSAGDEDGAVGKHADGRFLEQTFACREIYDCKRLFAPLVPLRFTGASDLAADSQIKLPEDSAMPSGDG